MDYKVIRSDRKTVGIAVGPDGVTVRAPRRMTEERIRRIVADHRGWIEKKLREEEKRRSEAAGLPPLTEEEIGELRERARKVLPERVAHFAPIVGVDCGRITVRCQKKRWGSCSSRGDLSFNCLLMLTPDHVIDYVVVHELCHRVEMNHSPRHKALMDSVLPDRREAEKWLRDHGVTVLERRRAKTGGTTPENG